MTEELMKKTYLIRKSIDSGNRHFVYSEEVETGYVKIFNYVNSDMKLLEFARDSYGMISDCFILYAVGHMGVAEVDSILTFLRALAKKNPDLNINCTSKESIKDRLRLLQKKGYLFKHRYEVLANNGDSVGKDVVAIYSLSEDAYQLVKQRLQKRLSINSAIQMKPMKELIGWACAGLVGSAIANAGSGFDGYLERVLRTKQLGAVYLPCELKVITGGTAYYIAVMSSYLGIEKSYQTESDYAEVCAFKINTIRNYLYCRTTKGVAVVVVAVADNTDLNEIAYRIYNAGNMDDYYGQIYFTGEGAVNSGLGMEHVFLQMKKNEDSERGYDIQYVKPPFMD